MSEKARKSSATAKKTKKTLKHWVAVALFAAIIIVFALWGVKNPSVYGEGGGGFAASVNDVPISRAEYARQVENVEQNYKGRFDQFPEAQRKAMSQELRRRALEELILGEVVYQAAQSRGVTAADGEVRDYILQIPFLNDKGHFLKDRYNAFLQNMNLTSEDFERQIRKQLVGQKMQDLFVGSAAPTREELKRNRQLTSQKVNLRYVEIKKDDLQKPAFISDGDVSAYLKSNKGEVENYYKTNIIEFTKPEKVHASHILIRIDEKRNEAQALKIAADLKKQATAKNFAKLAQQNSDDPGSKSKGGDLGEFERGRMAPEFEKAAFQLASGQISEPVKTSFGYHIIFVDKKVNGGTETLEQVQSEIARKLLLRGKESEIVAKTKTLLEKSAEKDVDAFVQKAGLKWAESGEFDLSAASIPKIGDSKEVVTAVLEHGKKTGLIPQLIYTQGRYFIVNIVSWKDLPDQTPSAEGSDRMVAYKKSSDIIEAWSKEVETKAIVQRNSRVLQ